MRRVGAVIFMFFIVYSLSGCAEKKETPAMEKPAEKAQAVTAAAPMPSGTGKMPAEETKSAVLPAEAPEPAVSRESADIMIVADFNSGEKPNNIGGNFGGWDKDPADQSQNCRESFDSVNRRGPKGFSMKLDYDVDSPNPAYNGFWMFLQNLDVSGYDSLTFWVKGDGKEGYTTVFKIELKNANRQVGRYYITNVTDAWQKIVIPLSDFKGITDLSNMTEFVIVFEDRIVSNKDGVIYIDDIAFEKSS